MRQAAAILLVLWVLVASPALCLGGLLEHACPCPDCSRGDGESDPQGGCPDGPACQGDPCGTHVLRQRAPDREEEPRPLLQPEFCPIHPHEPCPLAGSIPFPVPGLAASLVPDSVFSQQNAPLLV